MEISGLNDKILIKRMRGIYDSVKKFYPGLMIDFPAVENIWTGLRPLSPDGLPYIGRLGHFDNVLISGGNAMLGISQGPGAGKLIAELVSGEETSMSPAAFDANRFD